MSTIGDYAVVPLVIHTPGIFKFYAAAVIPFVFLLISIYLIVKHKSRLFLAYTLAFSFTGVPIGLMVLAAFSALGGLAV